MTEQKIHEILAVNDPNKLQKFLRNIKPFKNSPTNETIPFELLEKLVHQYHAKYEARIVYINLDCRKNDITGKDSITYSAEFSAYYPYKSLTFIYADSIYSLYAKISIAFYLYAQAGKISRKTSHPEYGV